MFPFIINRGDLTLPTFFFMIMVASLAATFYMYAIAKRKGLSQIVVLDLAMVCTLVGIIGARLFHVFVEAPAYYLESPIRVFYVWQGGFVGYGAFIGVIAGMIVYLKARKLPILPYADLIALSGPLIIFFMRVGCVGAGCCYGKPTDFFIHLVFTDPASDAGHDYPGVPLHAAQLYDMLNAVICFAIVHWVERRKAFQGQVTLVFLMAYAVMRFFVEFLRGDEDRGIFLGGHLSTSQITGIVIVAVCSLLYGYWKKRYPIHSGT